MTAKEERIMKIKLIAHGQTVYLRNAAAFDQWLSLVQGLLRCFWFIFPVHDRQPGDRALTFGQEQIEELVLLISQHPRRLGQRRFNHPLASFLEHVSVGSKFVPARLPTG